MSDIILTPDQQAAYETFVSFIVDPKEEVLVIGGYAGTGKSTLVNKLITDLPATLKTARLLNTEEVEWKLQLTATTNKACEALAAITYQEVRTIQSFLGLRVQKNHKTGDTTLEPHAKAEVQKHFILFIDEASYVDSHLLGQIFEMTHNCKIIFIGDPAQLTPVKSSSTPVFAAGFTQAQLTKVVRQAEGNPIIELATAFRNTVNSGQFFQFKPDGEHIRVLDRDGFGSAILAEFDRPDWHYNDSKVLAWTNKTVIGYNHAIRERVEGLPELQVGDYAVCNQYMAFKNGSIKTDETVMISAINPGTDLGVEGWYVEMNQKYAAFLPRSLDAKKARIRQAKTEQDWNTVARIDGTWVDLRAAYACTINKSQGSTYDRVFIDLDDISKCHNGNQIARMLYVAVSRARHQVFLTGDLV